MEEEQKAECSFKVIKDHKDNYWDLWNTCALEVQPIKTVNDDSLFAVSLIKQSFDQASRDMRVIEFESETSIRIVQQEDGEDEWFMTETQENDGLNKKMIKLVSQDDGSQKLHFYDDSIELKDYSVKAPIGDDTFQFQNPFWADGILISSSINEGDGTLTWITFSLVNDKPEQFELNISILPTTLLDYPIMCHLKQDHLGKELVINHLTDKNEPERTFIFGNTRFVAFLVLGRFQAQSRIAFLGADIDDKDLSVTIISQDGSYKKRNRSSLFKWSV